MERFATIMLVTMTVIAVFLFSFGVPWHTNFFEDFNIVKDGFVELAAPIKTIADSLKNTYSAVMEAKIFYENYDFWQGKIAKWAYNCGLRNPYEMTQAECMNVFREFDAYVAKAFENDTAKQRQFITECERYVYFLVYQEVASGNIYFTWSVTTRPGQYGSIVILFNTKPDQHWLFKFIDDYSWFDLQKCFMGYYKEVGDVAVSYKTFDVALNGDVLDFYVMTPPTSIHGHSMMNMRVLDVIPFSYNEFVSRCGSPYPYEANLPKQVVSSADLRY